MRLLAAVVAVFGWVWGCSACIVIFGGVLGGIILVLKAEGYRLYLFHFCFTYFSNVVYNCKGCCLKWPQAAIADYYLIPEVWTILQQ